MLVLYLPIKGTGSAGRLEGSTKGGGPPGPRLGVPRQCQFANGRGEGHQEGGVSRYAGDRCTGMPGTVYGGEGARGRRLGWTGAGSVGCGSPVDTDTMSVKAPGASRGPGGAGRGPSVEVRFASWRGGAGSCGWWRPGGTVRACPERHARGRWGDAIFFVTSRGCVLLCSHLILISRFLSKVSYCHPRPHFPSAIDSLPI